MTVVALLEYKSQNKAQIIQWNFYTGQTIKLPTFYYRKNQREA